jgi:transcriptional regulator with XRE-family HTH domain
MNNNEKNRYIELGNFLKSRRGKIQPSQFGLSNGVRRRTPGLRREEVAQLAGVSSTWYTWLEQGRPINVSDQLLESLSRVLLLTKEERDHLFALAAKTPPSDNCLEQSPVTPALQNVLDSLDLIPAYIMDNKWNVIAWNRSACEIFLDFTNIEPEERNIVWMMFTNSNYMSLFDDWAFHAKGVMARFRATYGKHIDDDWFTIFVNKLKKRSSIFNEWWSIYDVHGMGDIIKEITHPTAGNLSFEFNSFDVSNNVNLKLILHTPLVGTDTKEKIQLLMSNQK